MVFALRFVLKEKNDGTSLFQLHVSSLQLKPTGISLPDGWGESNVCKKFCKHWHKGVEDILSVLHTQTLNTKH